MKIFHFKSVNMNTILKMLNKCHLEHGHWLCTDKTLHLSKTENRLEYFWYFTGCIVIWFWIQFWNVKYYELNLWKPHGKRTLVFEAILNKWINEWYYTIPKKKLHKIKQLFFYLERPLSKPCVWGATEVVTKIH